jgi:septal ring factor EnvC (AmiA/AmiB activator)
MEQKAKFIILGLVIVSLVSFVITLQMMSSRKALEEAKEEAERQTQALEEKNKALDTALQQKKKENDGLTQKIDEITQEKDELQTKYFQLESERTKLADEIKFLKTQPVQVSQQPQAAEGTDTYWAGILKSKLDLELQLEKVREQLKDLNISNEQLKRQGLTFDLELKNVKRERDDLQRGVEYSQKMVDSLSADLVREKKDKINIQDTLRLIRSENSTLRQQLQGLSSRKVGLERQLQSLEKEKQDLEHKLVQMETVLTDQVANMNVLRDQLDVVRKTVPRGSSSVEPSVELPPIIVQPQGQGLGQRQDAALGEVLAVNKENNFVVIDLGESAGLKLGDRLNVYRQDKIIAVVKVIRTRKTISACDIERELLPIITGDLVK